jgi:hypothetical protein
MQANFLECYIRVWPSGTDGQHTEAFIAHIESAQSGSTEDVVRYLRETRGFKALDLLQRLYQFRFGNPSNTAHQDHARHRPSHSEFAFSHRESADRY